MQLLTLIREGCISFLSPIVVEISACTTFAQNKNLSVLHCSIFLYVLTPEGDIKRVPVNQVLGGSFFFIVQC